MSDLEERLRATLRAHENDIDPASVPNDHSSFSAGGTARSLLPLMTAAAVVAVVTLTAYIVWPLLEEPGQPAGTTQNSTGAPSDLIAPTQTATVEDGATSAPAPGSPGADPLTRIEWQLVEMVISGRAVDVEGVDAVLRFDGAGGYSANACNHLEGEVDIGDATLVLQAGASTAVFCGGLTGEIDDALSSLAGSAVAWSVDGDGLLLAAEDGTTLRYHQRDSIYPGAGDDLEVVAGERGGWQYRLSVSQADGHTNSLDMASRAGPGQPWNTEGLGAPSPGEAPMWAILVDVIDGQNFVAGFVPATTAHATHQRTPDAEPVDLTIHDIGDEQWVVVAGFVPEHSPDSVISAYDTAGALITQWGHESSP